MPEAAKYVPYTQHAQCLLSFMELDGLLTSVAVRADAETLAASFVQLDEAADPERFQRIGRRLVDFVAKVIADAGDGWRDGTAQSESLHSGIAAILTEELGLPEISYRE